MSTSGRDSLDLFLGGERGVKRPRQPVSARSVEGYEGREAREGRDAHDPGAAAATQRAGGPLRPLRGAARTDVRVFSQDEVRQLARDPPRPGPRSAAPRITLDPNFTDQMAMRWRLRGFLGETGSVTSFVGRDTESERFTLGSDRASRRGAPPRRALASLGTSSSGLDRALQSTYAPGPRKKPRGDALHGRRARQRRAEPPTTALPGPSAAIKEEEDAGLQPGARASTEPGEFSFGAAADVVDGDRSEREEGGAPETSRLAVAGGVAGGVADGPGFRREPSLQEEDALDRTGRRAAPSRLSSGPSSGPSSATGEEDGLFVSNSAAPRGEEEDAERSVIVPRPREPHDIEAPLVFDVPITEMPAIDWGEDELDVDGEYLQQQLEFSESESEDESDVGSIVEMIEDDSSEDETFVGDEKQAQEEWRPPPPSASAALRGDASSDSDSDTGGDEDGTQLEALTASEDDENVDSEVEVVASAAEARRLRPKRHRIPTVKWWLGERIEYEAEGKHALLTAVDVRRVEPPVKTYRRRRQPRRRPRPALPLDEAELEASQEDVQVPVFDSRSHEWHDRTVARSVNGLDFHPVTASDGSRVPLVTRCILFGGKSERAPLRLCVIRIEPGGMYSSSAEQNKASTFVVWRGKCTVHMNSHEFSLTKGMACLVPRGNDFFLDNESNGGLTAGDVYLFVTEVNAESNPELADALARDAQSMVSGTAAFSNIFESERSQENDDADADAGAAEMAPPESDFEPDVDVATEPRPPLQQQESPQPQQTRGAEPVPDMGSVGRHSGTTDTFMAGFDRAMQLDAGAPLRSRPLDQAAERPLRTTQTIQHDLDGAESLDSMSLALRGGESFRPLTRRPLVARTLAGAPPTRGGPRLPRAAEVEEDEDSTDVLSDFLEGKKGHPERLFVVDRPMTDLAAFRINSYLRAMEGDAEERH